MAKILVVDDEVDILKVLEKELSAAGYDVVVAQTAKEGIEKAIETLPDLILMDVILPDMGGAEAVKAMHNDPKLKDIPIIFLTAMVKPEEEKNDSFKINVNEIWYETVGKPFDRADLFSKIAEKIKS